MAVTETAKNKLKIMDVWDDEAGLTAFVAQQAELIKAIEADPANQQEGFKRFTPAASNKTAALSLSIQQAMDRRLALQGTPATGLAGFSNRRR